MQTPLKSFLSSCFPSRCDSIIGGKYTIKHMMFEEIYFLNLLDLQDNYLSVWEWWEKRGKKKLLFHYDDTRGWFNFIPAKKTKQNTKTQQISRRGVTSRRHACSSAGPGWLHVRARCYSARWPAPLSHFHAPENLHSELADLHISCAPNMSRPKRQGAFVTSGSHTGVSQTAGSLCKFWQRARDRSRVFFCVCVFSFFARAVINASARDKPSPVKWLSVWENRALANRQPAAQRAMCASTFTATRARSSKRISTHAERHVSSIKLNDEPFGLHLLQSLLDLLGRLRGSTLHIKICNMCRGDAHDAGVQSVRSNRMAILGFFLLDFHPFFHLAEAESEWRQA